MPPSASTHQIVGETDRLNDIPHKEHNKYIFGDVADEDGKLKLREGETFLNGISRGGATLCANVNGTDPGAGGGGNPTIQAQHVDRNEGSRIALLSMIPPGSGLYTICSGADFTTGKHIWDYLNGPNVVYIQPPDDVADDHKQKVRSYTYLDMPVEKQNENLCLNFAAFLKAHNPKLHTNFTIPESELIATYCYGLHPEAKIEANNMRSNLALAGTNGCCYPANYPAHHPLSGTAHPNANALSLDLLSVYVHKIFANKLRAGLFRLKGKPVSGGLNAVALAPEQIDTDGVNDARARAVDDSNAHMNFTNESMFYMSLNTVGESTFHDYALNVLNREVTRMRTCRNCGGVNHFSHRDGVLICPTPDGSVPQSLLRNIRYPFGVTPWRFGNGKGKGKGKGKGGRGGRGHGGRGGYWMHYPDDDTWVWEHESSSDSQQRPSPDDSQSIDFVITDDYDGFND
jgi:hypothetical protein